MFLSAKLLCSIIVVYFHYSKTLLGLCLEIKRHSSWFQFYTEPNEQLLTTVINLFVYL
jgi:hypothetical protein